MNVNLLGKYVTNKHIVSILLETIYASAIVHQVSKQIHKETVKILMNASLVCITAQMVCYV